MPDTAPPAPPRRQRNRRGEGYRLREDIITAATAILERTGTEEAVTLRGIAREVGVSAPSVAQHFADRAAIIDAVVARELTHLKQAIDEAAGAHPDPAERFLAFARTYLRFGREHPTQYRVLFERRYLPDWATEQREMADTAPLFAAIFATIAGALQEAVDTKRSASADAVADTVAVWYFLHGMVALPAAITSFAWPDHDTHLTAAVTLLAHLTPPSGRRARRA